MRVSAASLSILLAAILCASSLSFVRADSVVSATHEDGTDAEEEELPMATVRRQDMNDINQPQGNRELEDEWLRSWTEPWWRSGGKGKGSSDDGKGKGKGSSDDGKGKGKGSSDDGKGKGKGSSSDDGKGKGKGSSSDDGKGSRRRRALNENQANTRRVRLGVRRGA